MLNHPVYTYMHSLTPPTHHTVHSHYSTATHDSNVIGKPGWRQPGKGGGSGGGAEIREFKRSNRNRNKNKNKGRSDPIATTRPHRAFRRPVQHTIGRKASGKVQGRGGASGRGGGGGRGNARGGWKTGGGGHRGKKRP